MTWNKSSIINFTIDVLCIDHLVEQRKPVSNNLRQEIELLANCYREITSSIPNPKTDIK